MIRRFGGPEVIEFGEADLEPLGPHDLCIRVLASSVNPADCRARAPSGKQIDRSFPVILGYDVCGVVERVGTQAPQFAVGDRVIASPSLFRPGANAEFVVVDARTVAAQPARASVTASASLPLVGLTAAVALTDRAMLCAGQKVLIHGCAGGVGHVAAQLAHLAGTTVVGTAGRDGSIAFCSHELPVEHVVDRRRPTLLADLKQLGGPDGFDVVLDTQGGPTLADSIELVRPMGHVVTIVPSMPEGSAARAFMKSISLHWEMMNAPLLYNRAPERLGAKLKVLSDLVDQDRLRVHVGDCMPIRDLARAHRKIESGGLEGKLAVAVDGGW